MSSEDFKSLILTDPDLIDEGIDVSGLRTQTDTNQRLLGAIEDYPGISYDPTSYSYLSDLNRLFASGLPETDTSQPTTPAPPSGGGGGGGGGTSPGTGGTTPTQPDSIGGFNPGVIPGPSGFIGLDPDMDIDIKDYDDAQNYEPKTYQGTPGGNTGSGYFDLIDNSGKDFGPYSSSMPSMLDQTGRMGATTPPSTFGTPVDVEQGFTQDFSAPGTLADPLEKMDFVSGAVTQEDVNNPKGLLAKLGLPADFDLKQAAIEAGINLAVGVPITLIAKALKAVLPERDPRQNALDEFYTTGAGAQYMDPSSPNYIPGMENYNTVSGGGLYTLTGGKTGEEPTYGLQEAYEKKSNNMTETLQNKYGLTDAEIASVKAGNITDAIKDKAYNDTMGTTTNLLKDLSNIEKAKKAEKGRLDLFSGDIQESGDASIAERIAEADRLGISGDIGVEGEDTDRFTTTTTPTTTFTGVNPFEDTYTGIGEFYTDPVTGVTQPGTGTVLGKKGIDRFDDAETGIELDPYNPNQRTSIIEQAEQLGVGNVEQHLDNNSKLAKARDAGLISAEDYNILGGYDVTQNITGGSTTAGAALNLIGGTARNLGEAFAGEQDFSAIPGTAYRNTQGGMGLISQNQKNIHNAIVNGDPYTDAGVAAIKNQIEMSRYQDPIMGMVNQNILADDTINRMTDDVDLDDFDTTPAAETARIEAERRKLQEINAAAERERRETAEREAAIERNRIAEVTRQNEIRRQAEIDRLEAARREAARQNQGGGGGNNDRSGGRSSSSGESDYGGFCFDPSTLIQMADGSTKQIKNIQLGDATKGGEVTGVFQFKAADEIHDYKGVTVAGSHYVKENGKFIMVQDSPLAVKIDKIPVVYSLDTTGRRIFINDIEFADYNGDGVAKNFLSNAGVTIEGFDIEVLRQVEQRLI